MTAGEIAARLNAAPSDRGEWIAHCPAHDDRSPSLSVAEGSGRRVLLFCHAGCEIAEIVRALGVELRDLFGDDATAVWRSPRTRPKPASGELRGALRREAELYREHHGIVGELRTYEVNAIRRAVAGRFSVLLDD